MRGLGVEEVASAIALGEEIALLAAQLDAGTHRLLACIREFDLSEEWHQQGAQSCAHWLTWRIGLDTATAREKVRVARALGQLPALDGALAAGRLSYAKVRAITRVATPATEGQLLEMALFTTGAQMERICRRFRGLRADLTDEFGQLGADDVDGGREVRVRALPSGMVRLEITLQADEADLVVKAIEKARDELRAQPLGKTRSSERSSMVPAGGAAREDVSAPGLEGCLSAGEDRPSGASAETPSVVQARRETRDRPDEVRAEGRVPLPGRADGLMFMAEASLQMSATNAGAGTSKPPPGTRSENANFRWAGDRYRVLIHLEPNLWGSDESDELHRSDRSPGSWDAYLEDGTRLSAEAFRRVSCDGGLVPVIETGTSGVLDVGRQSRAIPTALRRALWLRDGGCRFPGCSNQRFIHGHHIRHWAHGGETALQNLALVCSFHHGLLHEGGFSLRRHFDIGTLEWFDPRGRRIADVPAPGIRWDRTPSVSDLVEHGVVLPVDAAVNACGWDGDPVDYEAAIDALIGADLATSGWESPPLAARA